MARAISQSKHLQMRPRRLVPTMAVIVYAALACDVYGQPTQISITPEPVGSGARALGQSAFIAVADDATAASWNPAGLVNLERPEASFVGAWRTISKDFSVNITDLSANHESWSNAEINFMSYARPLTVGNADAVFSVNYHQVYDLATRYNYLADIGFGFLEEGRGKSEGAISAYSLAGALSMPSYPALTIGAALNLYSRNFLNDFAWRVEQVTITHEEGEPPDILEVTETFDDFRGHNFSVGVLWDIYERQENLLTLGLVCHTPFTAEVDRELLNRTDGVPAFYSRTPTDIDFPLSLGAGLNYRFSDRLSVAFDTEWRKWSSYKLKFGDGTSSAPVEDDTLAFRIGAESLAFSERVSESVLAYRGGLFYEPRPSAHDRDPLSVYGFSLGLGWTVKERFSLDFAYQYRWGQQDLPDFDSDIREHFLISSLVTYF